MLNFLKINFLVLIVILLGACSSNNINLHVGTDKHVNPSVINTPAPIAVTIFQLANTTEFYQLDYQSLLNRKLASAIAKKTLVIWPAKNNVYMIEKVKGAKYIGIVAGYRNLESKKWRYSQMVKHSIYIRITSNGIIKGSKK